MRKSNLEENGHSKMFKEAGKQMLNRSAINEESNDIGIAGPISPESKHIIQSKPAGIGYKNDGVYNIITNK